MKYIGMDPWIPGGGWSLTDLMLDGRHLISLHGECKVRSITLKNNKLYVILEKTWTDKHANFDLGDKFILNFSDVRVTEYQLLPQDNVEDFDDLAIHENDVLFEAGGGRFNFVASTIEFKKITQDEYENYAFATLPSNT